MIIVYIHYYFNLDQQITNSEDSHVDNHSDTQQSHDQGTVNIHSFKSMIFIFIINY